MCRGPIPYRGTVPERRPDPTLTAVAITTGSLRVIVDCEPAILREVVSLALAGVPGIVLLGNGSDDADVVVASNPPSTFGGPSLLLLNEAGGLGQLLEAIHRLLPDNHNFQQEEK